MCFGSSLLGVALAVGGQILSMNEQRNRRAHQAAALARNKRAAEAKSADHQESLSKSHAQASHERQIRLREDLAQQRVISGEAGIGGYGMYRILRDVASRSVLEQSIADSNYIAQYDSVEQQNQFYQEDYQANKSAIRDPSAITSGLQIIGTGYEAYTRNQY